MFACVYWGCGRAFQTQEQKGAGQGGEIRDFKKKDKVTKFLNIKKQDLKAAIPLRKMIHSRYKGQGELSLIYKNSHESIRVQY